MIRDIGQGRHEKRWNSGIIRVRGKAGGLQKKKKTFFLDLHPPRPSSDPELFLISFSSHDLVALYL